jgi:choice-of-anchor B domain-containing protein
MEQNMKEKIRQHNECAAASECPINRRFQGATKCVDGRAGQYACNKIDMLSFVPIAELGSTYDASDSWGWTDPETGDEIAIIGMMDSTAFVQITDPENPVVLGNLAQTGTNNRIWVDMKVYNNHCFIIREAANHGMQVFDLTKLREFYNSPSPRVRELQHDAHYTEVTSVHNVVINEETAFAYLVGSKTCRGGLHTVDIREPTRPTYAGCFDEDGYTHDAQCVIYKGPDTRYSDQEICFNYNEDTLTIVDVSDKSDMKMLGRVTYDNAYYTHQGWLTDDMAHLMLNDELDESNGPSKNTRTMLWDVTDLRAPTLVGSHYADVQAIDHNLYIKGPLGYLANYCSGLRILDSTQMADGRAPEVAYFDMVDYCDEVAFKGAWSNYPYFKSGTIIVSSIELGLFMLKLDL